MSEHENDDGNGGGPPPPMAPPPPVVRVKKMMRRMNRGEPAIMQTLVIESYANYEKTRFTVEGSKHGNKTGCDNAVASIVAQSGNITNLSGPTYNAALTDLRTRVEGGDFSMLTGVSPKDDAHAIQIAKEFFAKVRKFEKRQKKKARKASAKREEQERRGHMLRHAATVAGRLPSSRIYREAHAAARARAFKRKRAERAERAMMQQIGGYGSSSSSGGGGASSSFGAGAVGVDGSAISRDEMIALRLQQAEYDRESGTSDEDSDEGFAGMAAEQPSARKKRRGGGGGKGKGKGKGHGGRPQVFSPERTAAAELDSGIGAMATGMPKNQAAKIASKERIEMARIEAATAREEADRTAAAERHKRELQARSETNAMFAALLKAVQKKD